MSEGKRRWRPVRAIFREGIEAALVSEPYFLATTKTRTTIGWIIRELVLDAGRGKILALKAMLSLLDFEEPESGESQADLNEPQWDWTPEGAWEGRPETEAEREAEALAEQERQAIIEEIEEGPARAELLRRLRRREAFKEEERERRAKLAEAASGNGNLPWCREKSREV